MSFETLDRRRAAAASAAIHRAFGSATNQADPALKKYHSAIRNASTYVRQAGLLQAVVFWLSKSKSDGGQDEGARTDAPDASAKIAAEGRIIDHLLEWLPDAEHTRPFCPALASSSTSRERPAERVQAVRALIDHDATQIRILEAEAEVYLGWLSRMTEGLFVSLEKAAGSVRAAETHL